jgi:hypothetical protein
MIRFDRSLPMVLSLKVECFLEDPVHTAILITGITIQTRAILYHKHVG